MESTYGNRSHNGTPDYVAELVKVFKRTFDRGGNVVIPSFAVGRTQELLYHIRKIKADGLMDRDLMCMSTALLQLKLQRCLVRM